MIFLYTKDDYPELHRLAQEQLTLNTQFFVYLKVKYGTDKIDAQNRVSKRDYAFVNRICEATSRIELLLSKIEKNVYVAITEEEYNELFDLSMDEIRNYGENISYLKNPYKPERQKQVV